MSEYLMNLPEGLLFLVLVIGGLMILGCIPLALKMRSVPVSAPTRDILQLILLARTLRLFLTGICLVGLALGALNDRSWLIVAAVVIGLEELYECGMALACLRRIEEREHLALTGGLQEA